MSDEYQVMEEFYPVLVQNYIRFETAAAYVKAQEEKREISAVKFKIAKDYYQQMRAHDIQAPLIGLILDYNEADDILNVVPEAYFLEEYENQIMRDVAVKQAELCRNRYSKFIEIID